MPAPKDFLQMLRDLAARVTRLEQRRPLAGTGLSVVDQDQVMQDGSITIPNNGLLLVDGGDVIMLNETLVEVFRVGVMANGDRGLIVRRDDGSVAFEVRDIFGFGDQSLVIRDVAGNVIGGDTLHGANGFDAPHIPMPFTPVDYASVARTTSSATFVPLFEHRGYMQNPEFIPQFMALCSNGTTSAVIQLYDVLAATYLNMPLAGTYQAAVPLATTTFTLVGTDRVAFPGAMSAPIHIQVHAKITAGAGSVSVVPVRMLGAPSI